MQPLMTDMMNVGSRNERSLIVPLVMTWVMTHSMAASSTVSQIELS